MRADTEVSSDICMCPHMNMYMHRHMHHKYECILIFWKLQWDLVWSIISFWFPSTQEHLSDTHYRILVSWGLNHLRWNHAGFPWHSLCFSKVSSNALIGSNSFVRWKTFIIYFIIAAMLSFKNYLKISLLLSKNDSNLKPALNDSEWVFTIHACNIGIIFL